MTTPHTDGQLRAIVERIERLSQERQDAVDDIKEVYAEAKGAGYDVRVLRLVIARRKREREDLSEEAAVLDIYEAALEGQG